MMSGLLYTEARAERLDAWRDGLSRALAGEKSLTGEFISARDEAILIRFNEISRVFNLPCDAAFSVIDGCRMDLEKTRYRNFDELKQYCHCVASA